MIHASGNSTWHDYPATDTPITAAALENVEALLDLLMNPPVFAVRQGTNQNLAVNSWSVIAFDATAVETIDTHGAHDAGSNVYRWVCPRAGIYLPSGLVTTLTSTATRRAAAIYKNSVLVPETQVTLTPSNNLDQGIASKPHPIACNSGDYLELQTFMNAGATTSAVNTSLSVLFLRPIPA